MSESENTSNWQSYRRLLSYLKYTWLAFAVGVIGYIIYSVFSALFAELLRQLIDSIDNNTLQDGSVRNTLPLLLILLVFLRGIGGFLGAYFMSYTANHTVHRLRCQLLDRFLQLPIGFYDSQQAGHLLSTVTFNVNQITLAITDALTVIFREGLLVLALLIYLFYLNWKLTLIFIGISPLIALVILYASKKFLKHSTRIQHSMGDVTQILSETLKGIREVRTFNAETQTREHFLEASQRNLWQNLKMAAVAALSTSVVQVLTAAALALLCWVVLAPQVVEDLTAGQLVATITVAGMMLKPVRQLTKINQVIQRGIAAAISIFELLDENTELDQGRRQLDKIKGKIEFRDINFSYDPASNEKALHDINLLCQPGQNIAIVGKSGSGKTTLVNLLARFYEADSGQILVDDIPIGEFSLQNLRQHIALVGQQVVLFNGTIRENIAFGSLNSKTDQEIETALAHANALEFINTLPHGLDTHVGDDATKLSGGQRQRLAIARALLKDAPILILDEATSALDSESERTIQQALETLIQGRTTFIIAHRLSTIENADRILVLDEGRLVESGTHQELLDRQAYYARLHQFQFSES